MKLQLVTVFTVLLAGLIFAACPPNEHQVDCATACPKTCNETIRPCPLYCTKGCVCNNYYVRENSRGKCIPEVSCKKECDKNTEVRNQCGTLCPGTCSEPVKACAKVCVDGCFCKKGYILEDNSQKCIKQENCPKANTTTSTTQTNP